MMNKFKGFAVFAVAASMLAGGNAFAQDAAAGKKVFMRCVACHAVKAGAPAKMGPNLAGVVGRKSGSAAGFKYSAAMQKANLKWDEATLDKWLTKPAALVPGTSMAFAGLPSAADRANVIAYLKKPVD